MSHLSHDDHVSQSHFPFSQGLLRCWGCVLLFSCLSLVHLLCRRVTFVTCRDREGVLSIILLFSEIFNLIGKYYVLSMYYDETIHN